MTTTPDVGARPAALSICSGIGGLDLATRVVFGARAVCYLEREAACIEILASRMEEGRLDPAPVFTDARAFDGRPWRGRVDLVTAGYPCQPFSIAGRGLAESDPRHLWPDIRRIVSEAQPTLVVLENVHGHLKRGFSAVLADLDELGFDAEWGVYSASQAGAPHYRRRLFAVAYTRGVSGERWRECAVFHEAKGEAQRAVQQREWCGSAADCGSQTSWPPGPDDDWSHVYPLLWPATEPLVHRVADEFPSRVDRLRALGNAVCRAQAVLALRDLARRLR